MKTLPDMGKLGPVKNLPKPKLTFGSGYSRSGFYSPPATRSLQRFLKLSSLPDRPGPVSAREGSGPVCTPGGSRSIRNFQQDKKPVPIEKATYQLGDQVNRGGDGLRTAAHVGTSWSKIFSFRKTPLMPRCLAATKL